MKVLREKFAANPAIPRAVPFVIFLILTALQGQFGEASRYWFYAAKTLVGAWFIWEMRPFVSEMKWAFSWQAVAVGVGIFAAWVGLEGVYPSLNELLRKVGMGSSNPETIRPWNPHLQFGENSALALFFIGVRIVGSTLIVPPLEEVFYRSFLYRWITKPDFTSVALNHFSGKAFILTALVFGFVHREWLPGILCGLAYQSLVLRKNRLGDAMTAHAITNLLLGIWVVWKGDWKFW